jgi:hypothetical protein
MRGCSWQRSPNLVRIRRRSAIPGNTTLICFWVGLNSMSILYHMLQKFRFTGFETACQHHGEFMFQLKRSKWLVGIHLDKWHKFQMNIHIYLVFVNNNNNINKRKYEQCLTPHVCTWAYVSVRMYKFHVHINIHRVKKQFVSHVQTNVKLESGRRIVYG